MRALLDVVRVELPVLLRVVDPPEEASALLLLRKVEEQLHDGEAVLDEETFPVVDLAIAALEHAVGARGRRELLVLEDLRMNPDDEHFLVMRAVEDPDLAARRQLLRVAPEVVVIELFGGRLSEPLDDDALRIDAAHHMPDRAVLAAGIEGLQHHQNAVRVLRREPGLEVVEHVDALVQQAFAVFLGEEVASARRVEVAAQDDI